VSGGLAHTLIVPTQALVRGTVRGPVEGRTNNINNRVVVPSDLSMIERPYRAGGGRLIRLPTALQVSAGLSYSAKSLERRRTRTFAHLCVAAQRRHSAERTNTRKDYGRGAFSGD
jgi:hypothetical protein